MNDQIKSCRLDTGDWIGSAWDSSPEWTPYAEAIADHYPIIIPWLLTVSISLSNTPADLSIPRVLVTQPQRWDVLIMGMSASQVATIATAGHTYLNITHVESGVPWVAPNTIGYAPLPAFAGMTTTGAAGAPIMPVMKLPEAFFLPAHTTLKLDFLPIRLDVTPAVTVTLTMHGVQLINPKNGFRAPQKITMPNGNCIPVGSRQPWFGCIPYGARPNTAGSRTFFNYELLALNQAVSYAPASDCNVEIHDIYASFLDSEVEFSGTRSLLKGKLDDTRTREDWTPNPFPVQAVFGSLIQVNPAMPLPKPQLLPTDHKVLMVAQNNDTDDDVNDGTVTFRGVRLCKY